jgi:hypothetical protein
MKYAFETSQYLSDSQLEWLSEELPFKIRHVGDMHYEISEGEMISIKGDEAEWIQAALEELPADDRVGIPDWFTDVVRIG